MVPFFEIKTDHGTLIDSNFFPHPNFWSEVSIWSKNDAGVIYLLCSDSPAAKQVI